MLFPIVKAVALSGFFCPLIASLLAPHLEVLDSQKRADGAYPARAACVNTPLTRGCWDLGLSIDVDMDVNFPNTGKVVKYNLTITNETRAPDGYERLVMLVNGQFPGPTLVADWGDTFEVTVTNKLTNNGTGLHWHGLRQLHSAQMDGVNGVTECPIAPGQTKTYRFQATQHGTSWYHSHYAVQYGEGVWGAIIINGPATANYDIDLGSYPLTDWYYSTAFAINSASLHANKEPTADNLLVNGKMTSVHGGSYSETLLTPGKSHRLRLLNVGINNYMHVALDGHKFTVITSDFTPIEPYETDSITIAVGQRYDVIIHANNAIGSYWLRVGTGQTCDAPQANEGNIKGIFRYVGALTSDPTSNASVPLPTGCDDETNLVPHSKVNVPSDTPKELEVGFVTTAGNGNLVQWLIGGSPMLIDLDFPTLQAVEENNKTFDTVTKEHVYEIGEKAKWQYWVIQQDSSTPSVLPHPIHLHGHDFHVLGAKANSQWTGDISSLNFTNPPRRDTANLPAAGWLVLAFQSDNPGTWLMHCHIPFHISAGFGVQFIERRSEIIGDIGSLDAMHAGCASWKTWEKARNETVLEEGDSGL